MGPRRPVQKKEEINNEHRHPPIQLLEKYVTVRPNYMEYQTFVCTTTYLWYLIHII